MILNLCSIIAGALRASKLFLVSCACGVLSEGLDILHA
jgi:hypothetical protein